MLVGLHEGNPMPRYEPAFAIKPLQQVSPGALVLFKNTPAFVAINRSAAAASHNVPVTLAVHDAQQQKFVYRYFDGVQPNVLLPTGELIVRPNLTTIAENAAIYPATDKLFIADDIYVVVQVPGDHGPDVRLLKVADGSLVRATVTNADGFVSWEMGVTSMGAFIPLLRVN
jgi:hypothetical protein